MKLRAIQPKRNPGRMKLNGSQQKWNPGKMKLSAIQPKRNQGGVVKLSGFQAVYIHSHFAQCKNIKDN